MEWPLLIIQSVMRRVTRPRCAVDVNASEALIMMVHEVKSIFCFIFLRSFGQNCYYEAPQDSR
jgi:hypothetical protein